MKRSLATWAAFVLPVWLVLILCTYWEPIAHDGWGHWSWHRYIGLSPEALVDFAKGTYVHNNPRLGQVLTLLVYTPGPWHVIVTPLVELSLFFLLATLVLGRWPSPRRTDDILLVATIFAMAMLCVPQVGLMLFYRPFTGNYLFGLVISLALLVPYRLHFESARRWGWWWTPLLLVLGVAAGLCNEHTGPGFAAVLLLALVAFWRRGERFVPWAIAGLVGIIAGGIALFVAPGQNIRYSALATHDSTLGRIVERGLADNARIVATPLWFLLPVLAWIVLAFVASRRERTPQPRTHAIAQLVGGGLAFAITMTLLASPKQGPRLYLATVAIACAAVAGWVLSRLATRWSRQLAAALAVVVIGYASFRLVTTYRVIGGEFAVRLAKLESAKAGTAVELPVYSIRRTRWSVGDDLLIPRIREIVTGIYQLSSVTMQTSATAIPDDP